MRDPGATAEGTHRYEQRFPAGHFRQVCGLSVSTIGLGTYLGEPGEETDRAYQESVPRAVRMRFNLFDTAINYRFQRSERSIGLALEKSLQEGNVSRDELVISTKGGFLSFDETHPPNPSRYFDDEFVKTGICKAEDLVAGCHCLTPAYLENQLERSLKNLRVDCIDIYFIHNPETQLAEISRQDFLKRMLAAFKMLERKAVERKIHVYGAATWNGFRETAGSPGYLSLEEMIGLAREAGGEEHHFRAIQFPFNLAMPQAFLRRNQKLGSQSVSLLEAASRQGMIVLCSASIF